MPRRALGAAITLAALTPLAARAATLCVDRTNPSCFATIGAAVAAAAPGDTVQIARGLYLENVTVPPGKDGLRIIGAGRELTVIDPDAPLTGSAIDIQSHQVLVRDLGIRNGQRYGIEIGPGLRGVVVRVLRIVAVRGPAALFAGRGAIGLQILSNDIVAAGAVGIHLSEDSENALVVQNRVSQVASGIVASGSRLQIRLNRVTDARTVGISTTGPNPLVSDNVIENVTGKGTAIESSLGVVRGNRLTNAGPLGVSCNSFCNNVAVAQNTSLASLGNGFELFAVSNRIIAEDNRAERAVAAGFAIDGAVVEALRNVAADSGQGFLMLGLGGGHTLTGNTALRSAGSGFHMDTHHTALFENRAVGSGLSGFFVVGRRGLNTDTVFHDNVAADSNAAGFAVTDLAVRAIFRRNSGSGNRYDLCDDGIFTFLENNRFTSISNVCNVLQ